MKTERIIVIILCLTVICFIALRLMAFSKANAVMPEKVFIAALVTRRVLDLPDETILHTQAVDKRMAKMKAVIVDMEDDFRNLLYIDRLLAMGLSEKRIFSLCENRGMKRLYQSRGICLLDTREEIPGVLNHVEKTQKHTV